MHNKNKISSEKMKTYAKVKWQKQPDKITRRILTRNKQDMTEITSKTCNLDWEFETSTRQAAEQEFWEYEEYVRKNYETSLENNEKWNNEMNSSFWEKQ